MTFALSRDRVSVVLVRAHNPLNIGAAARAMVNFGFDDLRVVEPYDDAWRRARSAVGASSVLKTARTFPSLAEAVADCSLVLGTASISRRHPTSPVLSLPELSRELPATENQGRLALVFGSEQSGLSNEEVNHCSAILCIPTQPVQESMNLGQAVAVCLYELARHTQPPLPEPATPVSDAAPATEEDRERLTQSLERILHKSGYIKPGAARSIRFQIREMLHRLQLSAKDTHWILGMLSRIHRKLGQSPSSRN